eukprot:9099021-Pyramimonas_sp.AAC.2
MVDVDNTDGNTTVCILDGADSYRFTGLSLADGGVHQLVCFPVGGAKGDNMGGMTIWGVTISGVKGDKGGRVKGDNMGG